MSRDRFGGHNWGKGVPSCWPGVGAYCDPLFASWLVLCVSLRPWNPPFLKTGKEAHRLAHFTTASFKSWRGRKQNSTRRCCKFSGRLRMPET